jgi:hypothetical protein
MIAFRKDEEPNKNTEKGLKKLLDVLIGNVEYYNGSFFKNSDLTKLIEITYKTLFDEDNKSLHIIIDKNSNNSIDITIDKIT